MRNNLYIKLSCKQTFVANPTIDELPCKQGALSCCHPVLPVAWQGLTWALIETTIPLQCSQHTTPCKNSCRQNPLIFMPLIQSIANPGNNHWDPILCRYNSHRCCQKEVKARRNPPRDLHPHSLPQLECTLLEGAVMSLLHQTGNNEAQRPSRSTENADEWKHTVLTRTTMMTNNHG